MTDSAGDNVIELIDVHKHFMLGERRVDVLTGIDLRIDEREALSVVRPLGLGQEHPAPLDRRTRQSLLR